MPEKSDIIFMNFSMHQYTISMIFPIFSDYFGTFYGHFSSGFFPVFW